MTIYSGREFSLQEIEQIRQLMQQNPTLQRTPLSRKLCEWFAWTKPDGELKDMSCRVAPLRVQADALITLPPSRMPHRGRPLPCHCHCHCRRTGPLLRPVHEQQPPYNATLWSTYIRSSPVARLWRSSLATLQRHAHGLVHVRWGCASGAVVVCWSLLQRSTRYRIDW